MFESFNLAFIMIDIVYSQPADTGTGSNVNTQLLYAVKHLKVSCAGADGVMQAIERWIVYAESDAAARYCNCYEYSP